MNPDIDNSQYRTYAWSYFSLHSTQRMQCFQFFIALTTALVGGFAVLLKSDGLHQWHATIWLAMATLSFVFWKLDIRTRQLVKLGESALKYLDRVHDSNKSGDEPHPLQLFEADDREVEKFKTTRGSHAHMSYSRCFSLVFTVFGFGGLLLTIICIIYGVP